MPVRTWKTFVCFVLCSSVAVCSSTAEACDVPVFRYALERWPPDMLRVVIFHRGPLADAEQEAAGVLARAADPSAGHANMNVRTVDLAARPDESGLALWRRQKSAVVPWMVLSYPRGTGVARQVWSGPLSVANARAIVQSPLRKEIVRRLTADESAVWILVESGRPERDDAIEGVLRETLAAAPHKLRLSGASGITNPASTDSSPLADRTKFSLLRLSRRDADERILLAMLLRSEEDLKDDYASEPIAFPVFGRGRVLYALAGDGISPTNILQACGFLVGPCGCEVKEDHPGTDLLIAAAWEQLVPARPAERIQLPQVIGSVEPEPMSRSPFSAPADRGPTAVPERAYSPLTLGVVAVVILVIIAAVFGRVLAGRRRPGS